MQANDEAAIKEEVGEELPKIQHDNGDSAVKELKLNELCNSEEFKGYLLNLVSKRFTTPVMIGLATQVFLECAESVTTEFGDVLELKSRIASWKKHVRELTAKMKEEKNDEEYHKCLEQLRKVLKRIDCGEGRKLGKFPLDMVVSKKTAFKILVQKALRLAGGNRLELRLITEFMNMHKEANMLQGIVDRFKNQKMCDLAATVCLKAGGFFLMTSNDYVRNLDQEKIRVLRCLCAVEMSKEDLFEIAHALLVNACPKNKTQMEEFIAKHFGDVPQQHEYAAKAFLKFFETFSERVSVADNNDIFKKMLQQVASFDGTKEQKTEIRRVIHHNVCPTNPALIDEFVDTHFATSELKDEVTQMFLKAFKSYS